MKGAPDRVVAKCVNFKTSNGVNYITDSIRETINKNIQDLSSQGLRVLAIAEIQDIPLKDITKENKFKFLSDITKYNEYE
jgi:magnesium-transporting ATPase (P-type)